MSLTQNVFQHFHPANERPRGMQGGRHWQTTKGQNIAALADSVWAGLQAAEQVNQTAAGGA